jgi:hypothetical protein
MKIISYIFPLSLAFIVSGCLSSIPTPQERKDSLKLLKNQEFEEVDIKTSSFNLFSLQKIEKNCKDKDLRVYIEGDGLAWITRNTISSDPTPVNPTALKLMNQDKYECKIYLARPCQYVSSPECSSKYWTGNRFDNKVIKSYDESLNKLKSSYKNKSFTIIGYSGGGAVATLVSAQRKDISKLITVAGNLDTEKWTTMHNVSKLEQSLNPADFSKNLENIEQYHLIGNQDDIIPKEVFLSYYSKFKKKDKINSLYLDATHNCCWEEPYKKFLDKFKLSK